MNTQPKGLIQVLLDEEAPHGDRHDAAMDLGAFDEKEVEAALAQVGCSRNTDESLADACGESLAELWIRAGTINEAILVRLIPASLQIALVALRSSAPSLAAHAENLVSTKVNSERARRRPGTGTV